ncbi:hypothetical protein C8Q76DRAFT_40294 [Earliella scabrosa]|nr:hypothetical protein C8Q76DRAFT_40294 [Earliella scabrosa]
MARCWNQAGALLHWCTSIAIIPITPCIRIVCSQCIFSSLWAGNLLRYPCELEANTSRPDPSSQSHIVGKEHCARIIIYAGGRVASVYVGQ